MATCTCSRCGKQFRVLPDEYGDHPCPYCGLAPWDADEQRQREQIEAEFRETDEFEKSQLRRL